MKNFILNVLPWIIGFVIGAFILWKVLIKPLSDIITLSQFISFIAFVGLVVALIKISDKIYEYFDKN